jgi:hypothetical protein
MVIVGLGIVISSHNNIDTVKFAIIILAVVIFINIFTVYVSVSFAVTVADDSIITLISQVVIPSIRSTPAAKFSVATLISSIRLITSSKFPVATKSNNDDNNSSLTKCNQYVTVGSQSVVEIGCSCQETPRCGLEPYACVPFSSGSSNNCSSSTITTITSSSLSSCKSTASSPQCAS